MTVRVNRPDLNSWKEHNIALKSDQIKGFKIDHDPRREREESCTNCESIEVLYIVVKSYMEFL